jgi:hypothetical protein
MDGPDGGMSNDTRLPLLTTDHTTPKPSTLLTVCPFILGAYNSLARKPAPRRAENAAATRCAPLHRGSGDTCRSQWHAPAANRRPVERRADKTLNVIRVWCRLAPAAALCGGGAVNPARWV